MELCCQRVNCNDQASFKRGRELYLPVSVPMTEMSAAITAMNCIGYGNIEDTDCCAVCARGRS
jgi:hypothetical protein